MHSIPCMHACMHHAHENLARQNDKVLYVLYYLLVPITILMYVPLSRERLCWCRILREVYIRYDSKFTPSTPQRRLARPNEGEV